MRSTTSLRVLWLAFAYANAQTTARSCPTEELACHDIMNSSQCIAQSILGVASPSKDALLKCLEYEGAASALPPATKVKEIGKMTIGLFGTIY
ncbi:hypothetical protein F4821DRAFT_231100 [Hypoxylon rubiginosum]|uniref:Uncharacterized protein n=1 Tax=Hypoxylon rubiginosum TaxID=110542 RepID=A0ACC0D9Y3_9PEZI|nr:hypothetical protein F4821DRAFT_231100 [Hypoxylon rubiginosum]